MSDQPGPALPPASTLDRQTPAHPHPVWLPAYWTPPLLPVMGSYASWGRRVAASLIDLAPGLVGAVVFTIGYVELVLRLLQSGASPQLSDGLLLMMIGGALLLLTLVWTAYNRWIVEGRSGQSLGKRKLKIRMVSLQTGAPVGPANAFIRDLVHIVDGLGCIGYLWPLWDERRQTFADKIMNTAVINSPVGS